MSKKLLVIGGILNTLFFILHVVLAYQVHNLTQLASGYRGLLEALSIGGVLFIFFFAFVSFFCQADVLGTQLGRAVLVLVSVLYLSRAAEEFFLFKFNPVIFAACTLTGVLYAVLLFMAGPPRHPGEFATPEGRSEEHEPELVGHR